MAIFTLEQLKLAESFIQDNKINEIVPVFEGIVKDIKEAQESEFKSTDEVQYFCFENLLEKLIYKKVEDDPRELIDVDLPFDRVYSDLAFCYIQLQNYDGAREALAQAVRWNPINCAYRLNLAELYRVSEKAEEWLGLSYSVFDRAYHPEHIVQAYMNFIPYMINLKKVSTAAALTKAALELLPDEPSVNEAADALKDAGSDPRTMDSNLAEQLLEEMQIPEGANATVIITALICSEQAKEQGKQELVDYFEEIAGRLASQETVETLRALVQDTK